MEAFRKARTGIARFQGAIEVFEEVLQILDEDIEELRQRQRIPGFEIGKIRLWEQVKEKEFEKKVFESIAKMLEGEIIREELELGFEGSSRLSEESLQGNDDKKANMEGKFEAIELLKEHGCKFDKNFNRGKMLKTNKT
jgi:hypothetical protein